jgi:hypothetical protein
MPAEDTAQATVDANVSIDVKPGSQALFSRF